MFPSYDAIVGHCWEAWNRVADRPWRVMSIELWYWVQVTTRESWYCSQNYIPFGKERELLPRACNIFQINTYGYAQPRRGQRNMKQCEVTVSAG